jgi:hypothetical protein
VLFNVFKVQFRDKLHHEMYPEAFSAEACQSFTSWKGAASIHDWKRNLILRDVAQLKLYYAA